MKHKILIVLSVIAVVALSSYAVVKYDRYKDKQHQAAVAAQAARVDASQTEAHRVAVEAAAKAKLEAACLQGKKAYDLLTAAQKAKVAVPNCDLAQVQ